MLAATGVKHGPSKIWPGDDTLEMNLNMKILSVDRVRKYHTHTSQTM